MGRNLIFPVFFLFLAIGVEAQTPVRAEKEMYILLNGERISRDSLLKVDLTTIVSISSATVRDAEFMAKYGTGILEIETKQPEEYELWVLDPGFNGYLATQPGMNFYSEEFLKARNRRLVAQWNSNTLNGSCDSYPIDYENGRDYGKEVEYQLYMYFRYAGLTN